MPGDCWKFLACFALITVLVCLRSPSNSALSIVCVKKKIPKPRSLISIWNARFAPVITYSGCRRDRWEIRPIKNKRRRPRNKFTSQVVAAAAAAAALNVVHAQEQNRLILSISATKLDFSRAVKILLSRPGDTTTSVRGLHRFLIS